MKSNALPSFWVAYRSLNKVVQRQEKKSYRLWLENPFHPSLHFKCVNAEEDVWSVRISRGYRALGSNSRSLVVRQLNHWQNKELAVTDRHSLVLVPVFMARIPDSVPGLRMKWKNGP